MNRKRFQKKTAPTIREVAHEAQVGISTVSRALNAKSEVNAKTRERVLKAAKKLGYVANVQARGLRRNSTNMVLASLVWENSAEEWLEDRRVFLDVAAENGFQGRVFSFRNEEEIPDILAEIISLRPIGVLVRLAPRFVPEVVRACRKNNLPMVLADGFHKSVDSIKLDRGKGVDEALRYLLEAGKRKIRLFSREDFLEERSIAYVKTLTTQDVPILPENIVTVSMEKQLSYNSGYQDVDEMLEPDDSFDAVLMPDDVSAIGAIAAIIRSGRRVPEDVAVVGQGDIAQASYANPALTTIGIPFEKLYNEALRLLVERLQTPKKKATSLVLDTVLVLRSSVEQNVRGEEGDS